VIETGEPLAQCDVRLAPEQHLDARAGSGGDPVLQEDVVIVLQQSFGERWLAHSDGACERRDDAGFRSRRGSPWIGDTRRDYER
jgi:hypothetical protein